MRGNVGGCVMLIVLCLFFPPAIPFVILYYLFRGRGQRHLFFVALLVLTGCATAAQRQPQQAGAAIGETPAQFRACLTAVITKPEYASLLPHTPDLTTGLSTAQLTDETFMSPEGARLLIARHREVSSCQTYCLNALLPVRPDMVPILADEYTKETALSVQLVERKITWGEGARQGQAVMSDLAKLIVAADRQWFVQRQAAGAALMRWSAQEQLAQQRMIDAMSHP